MKQFSATITGTIVVATDQQCDAEILLEKILGDVQSSLAERGSITDSTVAVLAVEEVPDAVH